MSNIEHASITDPNIHEPKGVAAASANTVYIANGSGSGSWGTVTSLVPASNPFDSFLSLYTTSTQFGSPTYNSSTTTWNTVTLGTTEVNSIASATVSSSSFSLPAGTYQVLAYGGGMTPDSSILCPSQSFTMKLANLTDSNDALIGATGSSNSSLMGRFTIAGTKSLSIQYNVFAQTAAGGLPNWIRNVTPGSGASRVMQIYIWKIS